MNSTESAVNTAWMKESCEAGHLPHLPYESLKGIQKNGHTSSTALTTQKG